MPYFPLRLLYPSVPLPSYPPATLPPPVSAPGLSIWGVSSLLKVPEAPDSPKLFDVEGTSVGGASIEGISVGGASADGISVGRASVDSAKYCPVARTDAGLLERSITCGLRHYRETYWLSGI